MSNIIRLPHVRDGPMTIGRRLLRVEDRPLLTGTAMFVDDLELAGMLHARFLRSASAHAEIVELELERARRCAGVSGAFAARDLGLPPLQAPISNPLARTP